MKTIECKQSNCDAWQIAFHALVNRVVHLEKVDELKSAAIAELERRVSIIERTKEPKHYGREAE